MLSVVLMLIMNHGVSAEDSKVRELMHNFYSTFSDLRPYVLSSHEFQKKENREKITAKLKALSSEVRFGSATPLKTTPGFRVTYRMLGHHFEEINKGLKSGAYEYARYKLNSTMSLCISCHTRLPKGGKVQEATFALQQSGVPSSFLQAEYQFLTKNFDTALALYNGLINGYPDNQLRQPDYYKSFERKLAIFTRIKRDPEGAIANFQKDLKNKRIPADIKGKIEVWIRSMRAWKEDQRNLANMSDAELVKELGPEIEKAATETAVKLKQVEIMRYSGHLYEHVFQNSDSKHAPEMLYLLSLCEDYLDPLDDFSLGLIYQKECVVGYPYSKVAKKCLARYRQSLNARYAPLPQFLKDSLKALEAKVK